MFAFLRQLGTGVRTLIALTVLLGLGYPLLLLGVGQLVTSGQAGGSLLQRDGQVVGSALIGQRFDGDQWFAGRPSAADYDALASGASNLGPSDPDLLAEIGARRAAVARRESVAENQVPPDAVTAQRFGPRPVHLTGVRHPAGPAGRRRPPGERRGRRAARGGPRPRP